MELVTLCRVQLVVELAKKKSRLRQARMIPSGQTRWVNGMVEGALMITELTVVTIIQSVSKYSTNSCTHAPNNFHD